MADLSRSQIDKLGERLRAGLPTEPDLRLLDEFKGTFGPAFQLVLEKLRNNSLNPTGRYPKTTVSIIAKLKRQPTKLHRMQDIAGCRIVVPTTVEQDMIVDRLRIDFPGVSVVDRRIKPSHGYRAVHLIVRVLDRATEIQIRTSLQQKWAEFSEKASDVIAPAIKYGQGPEPWKGSLTAISGAIAKYEEEEQICASLEAAIRSAHSLCANITSVLCQLTSFPGPAPDAAVNTVREQLEQQKRIIEEKAAAVQARVEKRRPLLDALTLAFGSADAALERLKGQRQ